MGRPRVNLNPKQGERLALLVKEQGITKKMLANQIFITPPTLSKIINGRASLTEDNARKINSLYPQYPVEWLLALTDYRRQEDDPLYQAALEYAIAQDPENRLARRYRSVNDLAALSGLHLISVEGGFFLSDGEAVAAITFEDYEQLCDELRDFAEFKARKLLQKALEKQNAAPGAGDTDDGEGQNEAPALSESDGRK